MTKTVLVLTGIVFLLAMLGLTDWIHTGINFIDKVANVAMDGGLRGVFNHIWCGRSSC